MDQPVYVNSTRTSISLNWTAPADDGGCPIYDYLIERDEDGTGTSTFSEVNPNDRNDPTLREFICTTFPVGATLG